MDILKKYNAKLVPISKKPPSQKRTFEKIVSDTIDAQIKIANGDLQRGTKKNKDGTYPMIKSWRDNEGNIQIRIGIKSLFEEQAITMSEGVYREFLVDLKDNWTKDPDIHRRMMKIKEEMEKINSKRSATRKKT